MTQLVTDSALVARINRKLRSNGEVLRKTRERCVTTLGDYFILDLQMNAVVRKDVDPSALAQELGLVS